MSEEAQERQLESARQQIEWLRHELEAVNSELDTFAHSVSHDLRAPLRSILGITDVLAEDCADALGEEGVVTLGRVRAAAAHMNELIIGLLQLSRGASAEFESTDLDLTAIVEQVVETLRQTSDKHDTVSVDVEQGMVCTGDARLIRVVMENLLDNALKFTTASAEPRVSVGVERKESEEVFFVADNGVGFDMRYADRLFTPFQRLHSADKFPGVGVGLATVRRIVRRHGGRIWAESEPGHGACFHFTLGGSTEGHTGSEDSSCP
ncbi:MAG: sensor histidine kinase [Chloroflexota bacterium]